MPSLASDRHAIAVLSPSTLDVCIPLSPSRKATVKSRCARYAHGSRCPLWRRTATPSLCSGRPHWTFVYRSRHRARRPSSRDALDVLTVLDALFCVGPAVAELSPSTSRTFIPLLPSYRAIVQVEMRSSCAHGSRCPFWRRTAAAAVHSPVHIGRFYRSCHRAGRWFKSRCALIARCPSLASGRRRCCALAVHIGRLYRSRHHARRSFKSRRARSAHGSRCPLWRRTAAAAVLSPSP